MTETERLRRELQETKAALKEFQTQGTTIKVSAKGGVSVYGLGKYPTTLYKQQWWKVLAMKDTILQFIRDHEHELSAEKA